MKIGLNAIVWEHNEVVESDESFEERIDRLHDVILSISALGYESNIYLKKLLHGERRELVCKKNQKQPT